MGAPEIHEVEPNEGDVDGGYRVTIYGENLDPSSAIVKFGEAIHFPDRAEVVEGSTNEELIVLVPGYDEPGLVAVQICNSSGLADACMTLHEGFMFTETVE